VRTRGVECVGRPVRAEHLEELLGAAEAIVVVERVAIAALLGSDVAVVDPSGKPAPFGELAIAGVGLGRYLDPGLDAIGYKPLRSS
jgi:hypothetical protein